MHILSETKAQVVKEPHGPGSGNLSPFPVPWDPRITYLQNISSVEAQFIFTRGHEIKLGNSFHVLTRSWKRNNVVIVPFRQGRVAKQMALPGRLSSGQEGGPVNVCRLES